MSWNDAFRTIRAAAAVAKPGDTIHILPGVYREEIMPKTSGTADQPISYTAEDGAGSVIVRGSVSSSNMAWTRLNENTIGLTQNVDPSKIYVTDLSSWKLSQAPAFIVGLDDNGAIISRLMPAREPDYRVDTEWKFDEFWWMANGGWEVARCDPTKNLDADCDLSSRSYNDLTDNANDSSPSGIEAGNLTSFGDLTGATLVAMDAHHAHYVYRYTIISHDVKAGMVTVDGRADNDGEPGLGWGSKYYVENAPALLDQPNEWWFDVSSGKLYLWPAEGINPEKLHLEISRYDNGFDLSNRSYITLSGLRVELYNQNAYQIVNKFSTSVSRGNAIENCVLQYANKGVLLYHYVQGTDESLAIDDFKLENSEIAFMDSTGFDSSFGWQDMPSPDTFSYAGVRNLTIRENEFHDLGFNSHDRSAVGVRIFFPDKIRFEGNHVYNVGQNGMHMHLSLIDSDAYYNLSPDEIKLGEILIRNNVFEKTCQAASDCGGLKIGGSNRPFTHVFKDVLISGNTFRNVYGWSFVSILRHINTLGDGNGFYLDYATGVHVYRNIAYNNTDAGFKLACLWRDGDAVFYNNVAANNVLYGFKTTGTGSCDDHGGSVNSQFVNNVVAGNGLSGFELLSDSVNEYGNLTIDYNLYYKNGWDTSVGGNSSDILLYRSFLPATHLRTAAQIRSSTAWEDHGIQADPYLLNYDPAAHPQYEDASASFEPTALSSVLVNAGTTDLPESLKRLLTLFGEEDIRCGDAYEIGRYELSKVPVNLAPDETQNDWPDRLFTPVCLPSTTEMMRSVP